MNGLVVGQALLDALQRICCGGVLLDSAGSVLEMNGAAADILVPSSSDAAVIRSQLDCARHAIKALLRAPSTRLRVEGDTWVIIHREGMRQLVLHGIELSNGRSQDVHTLVVLIDLQTSPRPNPRTLQDIFGLTPAEANLAVRLAAGQTLAEIASRNKVSVATARTQLAAVFAKTRTRRQGELVALLARVAILP